jgi:hypothetical protein
LTPTNTIHSILLLLESNILELWVKLEKHQHQNPEFGHNRVTIQKKRTCKKKYISIQGGDETQKRPSTLHSRGHETEKKPSKLVVN